MNRTAKIFLGILVGLIALCLFVSAAGFFLIRSAGSMLERSIQTDPDKATAVASDIADFTLPAGFGSPYATQLAGFSVVQYNHTDGHSHVSFFQTPKWINLDQAEMERQFRETDPDKANYGNAHVQLVDQIQGTINDQPVTLMISEGTNSAGEPYREYSSIFQSKSGQTLVVYEAPLSRWDQTEVDDFLASIH